MLPNVGRNAGARFSQQIWENPRGLQTCNHLSLDLSSCAAAKTADYLPTWFQNHLYGMVFHISFALGTYVARSKPPNKKWLLAVRMVLEYCSSAGESPKMIVQIAPTTRSYLFFDETAAFQLHHH